MERLRFAFFLFIILSCNQKQLIESNTLAYFPSDTIYYDVFQTGLDNYIIEVKSKGPNGVYHLFDYIINDGIFTSNTLKPIIKGDTVFIITGYPVGDEKAYTSGGKLVKMQNP